METVLLAMEMLLQNLKMGRYLTYHDQRIYTIFFWGGGVWEIEIHFQ